MTDKIHRTDDRVDRLYAQSRTYVINSVKLEELWASLGEEASAEKMVGAQAGKVFADEVAAALGCQRNRHQGMNSCLGGRSARSWMLWGFA